VIALSSAWAAVPIASVAPAALAPAVLIRVRRVNIPWSSSGLRGYAAVACHTRQDWNSDRRIRLKVNAVLHSERRTEKFGGIVRNLQARAVLFIERRGEEFVAQ